MILQQTRSALLDRHRKVDENFDVLGSKLPHIKLNTFAKHKMLIEHQEKISQQVNFRRENKP